MNGGLPLLRDRLTAAVFIVVMYVLLGGTAAGLLAVLLAASDVGVSLAVAVGGILGAFLGVWRVRRTRGNERADDESTR
ncbi:hypothetical protein [Streptomyces sp. NPDC096934]|uniref:hypothetical protein n=1 Tax=Streptomyces sp. NPDC096934 TaxID=3155551 RepID=UPI00331752A1